MTIATLDGALAGMQAPRPFAKAVTPTLVAGRPASLWGLAGAPGAGSWDTTLNGVVLSSSSAMVNGQLPHVDPGSGNAYLARLQAMASQAGTLLLLDRLWHNGGFTITSTSAQSITSPAWPARDVAGSTNGDGVLIGLEVSAAAGAAAPTLTLAYTNQAGTASRSATNLDATQASPAAGAFYRLGLQAGDTGVRSVQSLTLSASWVSGTINLVAFRILAALELTAANTPNAIDALTSGFPRLFNGVVPYLVFVPSTTTASNISGTYVETQG
jgi:hypothetical protein